MGERLGIAGGGAIALGLARLRPGAVVWVRSGVDPAEVEDVIAGCVQQFGEQAFNVARNAWLQDGLPI